MSTVLVTGFGNYADETDNPSGVIARRLDGRRVGGCEIVGAVLSVNTATVETELASALDRSRPDVVVVTGVAPGRTAPALERAALNVRDFPIPDTDGREPIDEPVAADGPPAYLTTLPIKAVMDGWHRAGIPGYVSNTAGTYLCNQTFYLARHLTAGTEVRSGMVHIPVLPARAAQSVGPPVPSMSLDLLEEAVLVTISVSATHAGPDLRIGAGTIS
ncbi:peptidase C15 [Rhodococcus sp. PSBB049]|uniref:pyroglutamyl-peptidase I family protein n=1 Tax=Rhodococcus sp. PSBB049 TaxID=2812863 RepID=UPI0019800E83|nr:peptidase C15 [Rhodococcus sp. PSBB049]QSE72404.1 peptidase C15 [Rhodococcus sp. PSBB049]